MFRFLPLQVEFPSKQFKILLNLYFYPYIFSLFVKAFNFCQLHFCIVHSVYRQHFYPRSSWAPQYPIEEPLHTLRYISPLSVYSRMGPGYLSYCFPQHKMEMINNMHENQSMRENRRSKLLCKFDGNENSWLTRSPFVPSKEIK